MEHFTCCQNFNTYVHTNKYLFTYLLSIYHSVYGAYYYGQMMLVEFGGSYTTIVILTDAVNTLHILAVVLLQKINSILLPSQTKDHHQQKEAQV